MGEIKTMLVNMKVEMGIIRNNVNKLDKIEVTKTGS